MLNSPTPTPCLYTEMPTRPTPQPRGSLGAAGAQALRTQSWDQSWFLLLTRGVTLTSMPSQGLPQDPHVHRAGHRSIYFTGRQSSHLRTPVVPGTRGPGSRGLGCRRGDGAMMWVLFGSQNTVPTGWVCSVTQGLSLPVSRKGGNELKFQHRPLWHRTCRGLPECVDSGPSASSWAMC